VRGAFLGSVYQNTPGEIKKSGREESGPPPPASRQPSYSEPRLRGSRSERGARVAALFYSLIESAKLCGVEPRAYLREATLRAMRNPGAVALPRGLKSLESSEL
jgi:transposase